MENQSSQSYLSYVVKLVVSEVFVAAAIATVLTFTMWKVLVNLNYEALLTSLVSLNAGIIIAMFVALFHSENKNIGNFKKFHRAAKQVYLIFLVNSAIACLMTLFISNAGADQQALQYQTTFNITAGLIAVVVTLKNVNFVYKLLQINFRTTE